MNIYFKSFSDRFGSYIIMSWPYSTSGENIVKDFDNNNIFFTMIFSTSGIILASETVIPQFLFNQLLINTIFLS